MVIAGYTGDDRFFRMLWSFSLFNEDLRPTSRLDLSAGRPREQQFRQINLKFIGIKKQPNERPPSERWPTERL